MSAAARPDEPVFRFEPGEREALPADLATHAATLSRLVIAVDGPAGSGKSSTARAVAGRLGLVWLDTGAMYRAVTLAALRAGIDPADGPAVAALAAAHPIGFDTSGTEPRVLLDGADVAVAVRAPEVTAAVSRVAAHAAVREQMVQRQREIAARGGVVLDGRDIGSVVLPHADLKVFVTADARTRAERRQREDAERGIRQPLDAIEAEIHRRDREDSTRAVSPLVRAPQAVWLDTTGLDFATQVEAVLALALRAVRQRPASPAADRRLVRAVPVDADAARQDGYRAWHSHLHYLAKSGIHIVATALLGQRTKLHPAVRLPGSVLVACNHIATLDPPVCGATMPFECWYVAKLELFRTPVLAKLIARFNAIPIHRGTADFSALDRAVALLKEGRNVFMFPEGTRQRSGRLATAKWGFGYVATRAGRPIVPVFVRGTRDLRPRGLRRQRLEVWAGEPFQIEADADADPRLVYQQAGALVMERIAGLMLRSAAGTPLPGLELPGPWGSAPVVETPVSGPA
jgi:cytidylate kinase